MTETFLYENEESASFVLSPLPPAHVLITAIAAADGTELKLDPNDYPILSAPGSLIKCTPWFNRSLFRIDDEAGQRVQERKLDVDKKYFAFWQKLDSRQEFSICFSKLSEIVNVKLPYGPGLNDGDKLAFRVTEHKGTSLYHLFGRPAITHKCDQPNLDERPPILRISLEHAVRFVRHLLEGLVILSDNKIQHGDLWLPNILVKPSDKELKEQVLTETLPVLIDFDLGSTDPEFNVDKWQTINWSNFMNTCRVCRFEVETCWLEHCMVKSDLETPRAQELIRVLKDKSLTIRIILDHVKMML